VVVNANNQDAVLEDLLSISDGKLEQIANNEYAELIQLLGIDATLKLYIHYRGCNIRFPKHFYRAEYVVEAASKCMEKREREKIAIVCGYTAQWLERKVKQYLCCCNKANTENNNPSE